MKREILMAIDQGTTGSTALLIDVTSRLSPEIIGKSTREFPQHFPKSGWVEHDLEEIWTSVVLAVEDVFQSMQGKVRPNDVVSIGITNQRETICVFDRNTGKPLTKAIVWQCRRSADICAELRGRGLSDDVKRRTGLVLDPYFSGTKIKWLMANNSHVAAEIRSGRAVFGTIDTFLLHRLTGGDVFATEASNASRTMLFNIESGQWDDELLRMLDVPNQSVLAEVRPSAGVFGKTRATGFLPDGVPIAGILGDQQAALAGQTCFAPGEAKCTYGTGAFLLLNTGLKPVWSKAGMLTTVAWNLHGELTYALEGSSFIAGAAIQFLRDQFGFVAKASEAEEMASRVGAAPDLYFVPALSGLGAPWWNPHARGALLGMHRGTTKAEVVRAALEGVAFQVTDLVTAMAQDFVGGVKVLRVDGGASANNLMMQFQADLLGVPVDRPRNIETTAMGAALFAGFGVGLYKSPSELSQARVHDRVFSADLSGAKQARVAEQKAGWLRAIEATRIFAGSHS